MAGYSGTPLVKKLGIKEGQRVVFVNQPRHFQSLLEDLPVLGRFDGKHRSDYIHLFVRNRADLDAYLPKAKHGIVPHGMIWVSWPKKSSGIETDVTEDTIRTAALKIGLVDVKVCAIDDTWSGLKLVIRKQNRAQAVAR